VRREGWARLAFGQCADDEEEYGEEAGADSRGHAATYAICKICAEERTA
jgi:hypothetical protein